jgi:REP element-mobilizing transposase RayT
MNYEIKILLNYDMPIKHFHRRNLPHLYYNEGMYFVTFRLYGSLHPEELKKLHLLQMNKNTHPAEQKKIFKKYDLLLDKPTNNILYLKQPEIIAICKSSIHYYDGKEFKLICYCIMPNHIHLVFELLSKERRVGEIVGSIKKYSARRVNKILKQEGAFWQAESFDRLVRDDVELYFTIKYVLLNPVNAGLVENWKEWNGTYCHPNFLVID